MVVPTRLASRAVRTVAGSGVAASGLIGGSAMVTLGY
jgi:hypothetical protein